MAVSDSMALTKRDREEIQQMIAEGVRAQLRELLSGAVAPAAPAAAVVPGEQFCASYAGLKTATGLSVGMLQAIRRASRGQPDSPFRGRGAFPSHVTAWLAARPDFAPSSR